MTHAIGAGSQRITASSDGPQWITMSKYIEIMRTESVCPDKAREEWRKMWQYFKSSNDASHRSRVSLLSYEALVGDYECVTIIKESMKWLFNSAWL